MSMVDAVLVATIVSYVLNRKWSFRTRGGRERHHEAALFFLVCGIGLVINAIRCGSRGTCGTCRSRR